MSEVPAQRLMPPNLIKHLKANSEYYQFPPHLCFFFFSVYVAGSDEREGKRLFSAHPQKHNPLAALLISFFPQIARKVSS